MTETAENAGQTGAPDDGLVGIRRLLGLGLMRASGALRPVIRRGDPIWARARLEKAAIEERYYFRQEISLNPSHSVRRDPIGHVEFVLPLDGEKYFTRQAYGDASRAYGQGADRDVEAIVGFLGLTGHEKTDLSSMLELDERHAFPIRAALPQATDAQQADPLLADRSQCVISRAYRPAQSVQVDAFIEIDIEDPDTSEIPLRPANANDRTAIMRQIDFKPGLSLTMTVQLVVPTGLMDDAVPKVTGVFVGWPTRTSLQSLQLEIAGAPHAFRYNPERAGGGGLEWQDVPMTAEQISKSDGGDRVFRSPRMVLSIPRPGELYRQERLSGEVEVTVDRLLSGTSARLFDSRGMRSQHPSLETRSVVTTEFSVLLEDAFARRTLSPSQQMHFDEVIPEEMRLDDIMTVLRIRGFEVEDLRLPGTTAPEADSMRRWLGARRAHGPYSMSILLYVEGTRYQTRRERQVHGGMKYETSVDSGELRIYAIGWLPRDSEPVVREMNALRQDLHERFDRLPARR